MEGSMISLLPKRAVCDVLVHRYLVTYNATHPIVDATTFKTEVDEFWSLGKPPSVYWLGLFLAVLALGYQLPVIRFATLDDDKGGRARGRDMMAMVRSLVFALPTPSRRSQTACFQTLVLLIHFKSLDLDWTDGNDSVSGLLGLASRMAFTMGFHRDPSLARGISTTEVQLRRRV